MKKKKLQIMSYGYQRGPLPACWVNVIEPIYQANSNSPDEYFAAIDKKLKEYNAIRVGFTLEFDSEADKLEFQVTWG